ncbi:MAG TPA: tol-pal system protein YbgF [Vicinamibacterales bacterium]|nr:tol-pal system protein YbgF [Vicinamibacterales bacterium]
MRTFTVALVMLAVAAPAHAQNRREMQMMADIRMLQEQNQQLQVTLAALADALKAINSRFDEQAAATRKGFADQGLKIDQFGSELRVVREGVADAGVRIGQLSQEIEAVRLSIPRYPPPAAVPFDPAADPSAVPPADPGAPTVAPPPAPVGPGVTPQRLLETARADYYAGQYDICVSGFKMYLETFPRSELAHEAQHMIGECQYMKGSYQDAVAAYNMVIANYPRTTSAPDAYYKRGMALEGLEQLDRARESYEGVIKNYPDTTAARLAKQAIDRLNKGKRPQ